MDGLFTDVSLTATKFINNELCLLSLSSGPRVGLAHFFTRAVDCTSALPSSLNAKKRKKKYSYPVQNVRITVNLLLKEGICIQKSVHIVSVWLNELSPTEYSP